MEIQRTFQSHFKLFCAMGQLLWIMQVKIIPSINVMYIRIYFKMLSIFNHK
jgi:hypothetical protein